MSEQNDVVIRRLTSLTDAQVEQLAEALVLAVAGGGSVGFVHPLPIETARAYWREVIGYEVEFFVAEVGERIVGTAHLELTERLNGTHRAEVCKVIVHPDFQRRGIAKMLMDALEARARELGRILLYLDTSEGYHANDLYLRCGYTVGGRIPYWAKGIDGKLHGTVYYYKVLAEEPTDVKGS